MRLPIIAAPLLLLGACSQQDAAPSPATSQAGSVPDAPASLAPPQVVTKADATDVDGDEALGPEGLGAIKVGSAPPASLKGDAAPISQGCRIFSDKARRVYAMTDGKVVTRVTAMRGSPVKTAAGLATGESEAEVRRAYPDVTQEPHKYVEAPAKYLDWRPGGGNTGLRFEIDAQGKVSAIHAGREPEIEYVEGCA